MSINVRLSTTQHQTLSPRQQQAIRMLQLSSLEFEMELRNALETNPFLEDGSDPAAMADEDFDGDAVAPEHELPDTAMADAVPESVAVEEIASAADVPALEEVSWGSAQSSQDGERSPLDWARQTVTLREHLHQQLGTFRLGERLQLIAGAIIDSLDDNGYLAEDMDEFAMLLGSAIPDISPQELADALHLVQELEPAGVGARNLEECLALQVMAEPPSPERELALRIVHEHMESVARHDGEELRRKLHCSAEDLASALRMIRRMNPRPGSNFGSRLAEFVIPEIVVSKIDGKWMASINPEAMPKAYLNESYARLCRRGGANSQLAQQLQEAQWLLKNAKQRFVTILRVAEAIVQKQRNFLEYGDIALIPMNLRHIAEELDMHQSTVSRATCNKYMATPRGIVELRRFFSRELATEIGGRCSATAIRAMLRDMIAAESPEAPLSDVVLQEMLAKQGIVVARRTVTKYRCMMKIPAAEFRRRIA